jgi:hypothetical protein
VSEDSGLIASCLTRGGVGVHSSVAAPRNVGIAGDELELIQADQEQKFEVLKLLQQAIELIKSDTRIAIDNV